MAKVVFVISHSRVGGTALDRSSAIHHVRINDNFIESPTAQAGFSAGGTLVGSCDLRGSVNQLRSRLKHIHREIRTDVSVPRPNSWLWGRHLMVWSLLLACLGCQQPTPGILTLAPAGMRFGQTARPNPDGSLNLPAGGSADTTAYAAAGALTVAVTAASLPGAAAATIALHVDGVMVGSMAVSEASATTHDFVIDAARSGPHTLRLTVAVGDGVAPSAEPLLRLEKVVLHQP